MKYLIENYWKSLFIIAPVALLLGCASQGTPSGGDPDLDPPKVVRANPHFNSTRIDKKKIYIDFDENVKIEKASEKVIITPPQKNFPIIQSINKRVVVELRDSLIPNTTYTIDFTDAIVDFNEGNPIENFSFSFSTGDVVDTLAVSGKVLSADNLEPIKGMYVGLHSNLSDTAFTKEKFLRISRTNDYGSFTIRGIAPGRYKIYALGDQNRDYMYDNPNEALAFFDGIIEPATTRSTRVDTVRTQIGNIALDSLKTVQYTRFIPDDIVLRSFTSNFKRQYLMKHERSPQKLTVIFGAPTRLAIIEPINFDSKKDWAVLEKAAKNDTLTYWIKDKTIGAMDSLLFKISYLKTDSLNNLVEVTDTLSFIDRSRGKKSKDDKKKGDEEKIAYLDVNTNLASSFDVFRDVTLEFSQPIKTDSIDKVIKLRQEIDSTFKDLSYSLSVDSLNPRKFRLKHNWGYGLSYRINIDSASIFGISGLFNDKLDQAFKVKNEDQYGILEIGLINFVDTCAAFVELLDKSDKPIRQSTVKNNMVLFKNLDPGEYYARIIYDSNENGIWDTGDYGKKIQPEMVIYCTKKFVIKAYADHEEEWDLKSVSLDKQKPLEITKNKPQDESARKKRIEQRNQKAQQQKDRNQQNTNRNGSQMNNGMGTMPNRNY